MTPPTSPRISVVIDSYNTAQFLGEAIQSVLDQTHPADQIVISDVSTDSSREIIEEFRVRFPQIVAKFGENRGSLGTLLAGLQEADGDLVFLLDADDRYQPGHLEGMMQRWREFPQADLIYCRHKIFGDRNLVEAFQLRHLHESSAWLGPIDLEHPYDWGCSSALAWCLDNYHIGGISSCLSFRRNHINVLPLSQLLTESGSLLKYNVDFIILLASALFGGRKVFVPNQTVDYRLHTSSINGLTEAGDNESNYIQSLGCSMARDWLRGRPIFGPQIRRLLDAEMQSIHWIAPGHRELYHRAKASLRDPAKELRAQTDSALRRLAEIEASTTWRMTWPLRQSVDFARCLLRPKATNKWTPLTKQHGIVAVDITKIWHSDSGTGIQRVVREIASKLVSLNTTHQFVLVDWSSGTPMDVTNAFISGETKSTKPLSGTEMIIMLDSSYHLALRIRHQLRDARQHKGIRIVSVCHDIFPITYPQFFEQPTSATFRHWLDEASLFSDAFVCNSRHTASELENYFSRASQHNKPPTVMWWPLGSNFSVPGWPDSETDSLLAPLNFLLMVGTVEPRKNYDFVLDALEALWNAGRLSSPLVVVGRPGWKCRHTTERLHTLEAKGRIFWHGGGLTDNQLRRLYQRAKVVIQASLDEGFGLPVAEATLFAKPVVLSDIPIFHEIVSENGYFFAQGDRRSFASALMRALEPDALPTKTTAVSWTESTEAFWKECSKLLDGCGTPEPVNPHAARSSATTSPAGEYHRPG
ncbi:MAG: glycosyltransferase [Chthoniobacterales bacterium]|nr:glycosyltransferase [Chthoniobacterales bacterium]